VSKSVLSELINQLARAENAFNFDIFWLDRFVFSTKLADFMLNTGTASLVSKRFFSNRFYFTLKPLSFRPQQPRTNGPSDAESAFGT